MKKISPKLSLYFSLLLIVVTVFACKRGTEQALSEDSWKVELDCPENTKRVEKKEEMLPEFFCIGENGKEGPWKEFDRERNLLTFARFSADKLNGEYTRYHDNGALLLRGQYLDNKRSGLWTEWYVDGAKRSEKEYSGGLEHGTTKIWYRNGVLMAEGKFVESLEEGPWKVYNPAGKLARECVMIKGLETDCVVHDKDFQIKSRKNENQVSSK